MKELPVHAEEARSVQTMLERHGVSQTAIDELQATGRVSLGLLQRIAIGIRTDGGDAGMLVYRLRKALESPEVAVEVEAKPTYHFDRDANEERATHVQGSIRQRVEAIEPAERDRCRDRVLDRSPWLRKIVGDKPVLESKIMRALVLTEWQRHGRTML